MYKLMRLLSINYVVVVKLIIVTTLFYHNNPRGQCGAVLINRHYRGKNRNSQHSISKCDVFQGNWIKNKYSSNYYYYPNYNSSVCSFIEKEFDCQGNGRPDHLYLQYIWKPSSCDLPKFDGKDFVRRLKGKKMMFVGDSLSLNMWQSLTCLLHASIPNSNFTIHRNGDLSTFTFQEFKSSIMLQRNPFLVDMVKEESTDEVVLKLDSIDNNGKSWLGFDYLIFNTWHWWLHIGSKQPWSYMEEGDKVYKDVDRLVAFKKGLKTWSKWVESNIDPTITKVFFQGTSPTHTNGEEWNAARGTTCDGETEPVTGAAAAYAARRNAAAEAVKEVLRNMTNNNNNNNNKLVRLLDVTKLSELRKDGHPSKYGSNNGKGDDCSHWCLPGVPDTWNHLLYAILVLDDKKHNIIV